MKTDGNNNSIFIRISGIVQGVGFRPFIHRLVTGLKLRGWVRNTFDGVELKLEGSCEELNLFMEMLNDRSNWPSRAIIESIECFPSDSNAANAGTDASPASADADASNISGFSIISSENQPCIRNTLISPDIGICDDCRRELFDRKDRRYHFPFINCTNCGPRFTIIKDVPYDRCKTSMSAFKMCPACRREYADITDRRYHAQPDCCAECGPELQYIDNSHMADLRHEAAPDRDRASGNASALHAALEALDRGGILAVKGIGGFHLACRTDMPEVIDELRRRKARDGKPFAVMCADLAEAGHFAEISDAEAKLLESAERPIVLLRKLRNSSSEEHYGGDHISDNHRIGIMLPYTPLHYLLLSDPDYPHIRSLVMTSANLSDRPIITSNEEALAQLADIADGFLMHNRDIVTGCDDSVCWEVSGREYFSRRSRGYVPAPVKLPVLSSFTSAQPHPPIPSSSPSMPSQPQLPMNPGSQYRHTHTLPQILACGAELKASFAMNRGKHVFISQHIGDLKNIETFENYDRQIKHFENLFDIKPEAVVCDLHPDYMSTAFAEKLAEAENIPLLKVQHHHAHMASCMADNAVAPGTDCLGIIWDGTGLGTDGTVWGAEFLRGSYDSFKRVGSIRPIRLPGGDSCMHDLRRTAYSLMKDAGVAEADIMKILNSENVSAALSVTELNTEVLSFQLESGINCPESSGMGRLFDGVSAILGIKDIAEYEGQGAILLESAAYDYEHHSDISISSAGVVAPLPFMLFMDDCVLRFDWQPMIRELVRLRLSGNDAGELTMRFMYTLCRAAADMTAQLLGNKHSVPVLLSGGSFQNMYLLHHLQEMLKADGFNVLTHRQVSCNDEGLSFGQLAIAAYGA